MRRILPLLLLLSTGMTAQTARITDTPVNPTPYLGLGIEFDPYAHPVDPARWSTMLDRVRRARTGFLRVMSNATDYCTGFDAQGNPVYRWTTNPNAPELQRVYEILDFAQREGIEVYLGEWSPPERLGIRSPDDPRWARILADYVQFLVRDRHYRIVNHVILMNEPNGSWMWHHSRPDFAAWSTGVRELRMQLDRRGLGSIKLAGPDNSGDRAWFERAVREMHDLFGAWEQHIYATDAAVLGGQLEQQLLQDGETILAEDPEGRSKPRFIAEAGLVTGKIEELDQQPRVHDVDYGVLMADYVLQVTRAGWLGVDAWDLDDAMHGNGKGGKKIWGFWDSSTTDGMRPRPWFASWSLLSRALPAGSTVMQVEGSLPPSVRLTAARWKGRWSILALNESAAQATIDTTTPSAVRRWHVYRYAEGDLQADQDGMIRSTATVSGREGRVSLELPAHGLVVLTSSELPR